MANAELERFRQKLREYRLLVNRSQGDLAAYLNLDYSELSNRLNSHKNAHLTHDNVRAMVRALADWGAITTRAQAEELLDLMVCPHFDTVDLQARPLSKLAAYPTSLSTPPIPASAPVAAYPVNNAGATHATPVAPATASPPPLISQQTINITNTVPEYNLPQALNPLLGREEEIAQVLELLGKQNIRLVTLTGAGGSGKTSLALAIAKHLLTVFLDGVYFAGLENVTRRESLITEIAQALNLKEKGGLDLLQSLKESLKEKKLLLVLDNFEQLIGEARLLTELLKTTGHLKLLVTSRIPLQLSFEQEFPVGPLALPDKEALNYNKPGELAAAYPGVALFVARAKTVKPDFTLSLENVESVVEICRRLDGLPLALELAAARIRTFSPQKLLDRLSLKVLTGGARDLPARQQTLWDTISWSYDLLLQGEQRLFVRLGVFVGGCTLEAAEAVCNPDGELDLEVFEGIESLLTRNLLRQSEGVDGETRYGMLMTIREFSLAKLAQSGELEKFEQLYMGYYLTRSRQLTPGMVGGSREGIRRLREIQSEYVNFRAVIFKSLGEGKSSEFMELSVALADYFGSAGYGNEGLRFLEQALNLPDATDTPAAKGQRATALWWAGALLMTKNVAKARRYIEEALVLQRDLNEKGGIIYSLNRLSWLEIGKGNYPSAERYLAESLVLSLELGELEHLENTRSSLAILAFHQSKYAVARRYSEENLAMCRAAGNNWGIAVALGNMGNQENIRGNYAEAHHYLEQSLALYRDLNLAWGIGFSLFILGLIAINQEEYAQARVYADESLALSRKYDLNWGIGCTLLVYGTLALIEGNFTEARTFLDESLAIYRELGQNLNEALCLLVIGLTASKQGRPEESRAYYTESLTLSRELQNELCIAQALTGLAGLCLQGSNLEQQNPSISINNLAQVACMSGTIVALLTSCEAVMYRPFKVLYEQNLAVVRVNLAVASFEAAFAQGQAMSLDEALNYALSE